MSSGSKRPGQPKCSVRLIAVRLRNVGYARREWWQIPRLIPNFDLPASAEVRPVAVGIKYTELPVESVCWHLNPEKLGASL